MCFEHAILRLPALRKRIVHDIPREGLTLADVPAVVSAEKSSRVSYTVHYMARITSIKQVRCIDESSGQLTS